LAGSHGGKVNSIAGGFFAMNRQILQVRRSIAVVGLATALLLGGGLGWTLTGSANANSVMGAARAVTLSVAPEPQAGGGGGSLAQGFADVIQPILPSVVNIQTTSNVQQTRQRTPIPPNSNLPDELRRFFGDQFGNGDQQPTERKERGLGSGVIISPDGYILTNNHVIENATDITVQLSDKRQMKAKLIGADPRSDVAVVQIQATGLTAMKLGDSSKLRVGDIVLAIGNPFGLDETVTLGIVSATGRRNAEITPAQGYADFIQTDAAINPGNSGGALVNARGELIGINTAIYSGSGGNLGIGFAIPVNMARGIMEQILKTGRVSRGYLGISIQNVTPELAQVFKLSSTNGVLVGDVSADSPGAKAGLQKGDVVVALNGQSVADAEDLRLRVSQMAPGTAVKVDLIRDAQKRQVSATLMELPETTARTGGGRGGNAPDVPDTVLSGLQVGPLTADIAQQLTLPAGVRGVVVMGVDPDSKAAEAGLQRGDIIQEVNRRTVTSLEQFRAAVRDAGNQPILLLVNHGGQTGYSVITP
jgi:serine protease Do